MHITASRYVVVLIVNCFSHLQPPKQQASKGKASAAPPKKKEGGSGGKAKKKVWISNSESCMND